MTDLAFFLEYEKRLARRRAVEVASDPLIFAGIKNWANLDTSERKLFIERCKSLCEGVMHSGMLKLEFFAQAPSADGVLMGNYNGTPDAGGWGTPLRINVHPEVLEKTDVIILLNTIPHELTHNYQDKLIANPHILPELFRDPISRLMKKNNDAYISSQSDYSAYRKQPLEEHAFAVGDAFSDAIKDFVASRNLLPNNFNEAAVREEYEQAVGVKYGRGRIEMPKLFGILETTDPYRHYYFAKLEAAKLMGPGDQGRWWEVIRHNQKALVYGENIPYDSRPAMQEIYQLAANEFFNDNLSPPRQIQVPDAIQKRARCVLEDFSTKGGNREARIAKSFLGRLEKLGPLPPVGKTPERPSGNLLNP